MSESINSSQPSIIYQNTLDCKNELFLPVVWHNLESGVDIYAVCYLMDFQMKQSSSSYTCRNEYRESECVLCQYGQTCLHRGSQSAGKKHPTGPTFTCSKSSLPLSLSPGETELVSFILCYLLISYSGTQSGGCCNLSMHRQQGKEKQFITEIAKTNTFTPV